MIKTKCELLELIEIRDEATHERLYLYDILKAFAKWSLNGINIPRYKSPLVCQYKGEHEEQATKYVFVLSDDIGELVDRATARAKIKDPVGFCLFHAIIFQGYRHYEVFSCSFVKNTYRRNNKRFYQAEVLKLFNNFLDDIVKNLNLY